MRLGPALLLVVALLSGCASEPKPHPTYYWGSYEGAICACMMAPDRFSPDAAVKSLEEDRRDARAMGSRLPPGWHAHLGTLYYQLGRLDQARREFEAEKTEFPESTVFMDRLLAGLVR